jgi:hypothetical protein
MFEDWKLKRAATKDQVAGISREIATQRYLESQIGARPPLDVSDPRLGRARAVVGGAAVIGEIESDTALQEQAMPAGHEVLIVVILLLSAAECYGCWDIVDVMELAEETRSCVALALAAFVMWMTSLAAAHVTEKEGDPKPSVKRRIVGGLALVAFGVTVLALAALRLGLGGQDTGATPEECFVMVASSLGPAVMLKSIWGRFLLGRQIAQTLARTRRKLKAEVSKHQQSERFLDAVHLAPSAWDAKAAVVRARFETEFDRAQAHNNKGNI